MPELQPADDHTHTVDTGKSQLSLDQLAQIQPGMARIMPEVGVRIWKCYYAGRARNRPLANFQLCEAINLLKMGALVRPKYDQDMARFLDEDLAPVHKAILDSDWAAFEEAFHQMVERANHYHGVYNKAWLRWKIPDQPPPDLDMTPLT